MGDQFTRQQRHTDAGNFRVVERGFVTTRPEIEDGERAFVHVKPKGSTPETRVFVPQAQFGDRGLPSEGVEVFYLRTDDDQAVLIGVAARDHGGYKNERRIDHEDTDSYVEFDEEGNVHIEAEGDVNIDAEGDVNIDAGGYVDIDAQKDVILNGGDVVINGVVFLDHTHDYDWTNDGGSDETDPVNQ